MIKKGVIKNNTVERPVVATLVNAAPAKIEAAKHYPKLEIDEMQV